MTAAECIIQILEEESHCLTFNELYRKSQFDCDCDCDWISFAEVLEGLVEQGKVQYTLPYGADVGCYRITEYGS